MRRRTTREVEEDDTDFYHVISGVLIQLFRLGRSQTLRRRVSIQRSEGPGELPTMRSLNLKRGESTATTAFGAEELDDEDPRVSGQKKNKNRRNRFGDFVSSMSTDGDTGGKKTRRASITYYVASASSSSSPKYS